ncbi:hypothetical protein [Fibrella aquatilis]|uniref:Outer membrane protein beta-barrel domain-containing protein n=1 Tax=Fibrella aquatilis TaxID=2817059 RepID=A0A939G923_9BACT|nr:hypothetical protein [Fibrella aquatilis]MBO0932372.1 hypothetical protein [Fibrella aquatilis]
MNRSNTFSSNNPPSGSPGVPPPSGTPDSAWASAFQNASEAPPARVWSGIERQLDLDDEDGVLPLLTYAPSRSVVFGRWVAGIAAALLLALLGWWSLRTTDTNRLNGNQLAAEKQQKAITPATSPTTPPAPATGSTAAESVARSDAHAAAKTGVQWPASPRHIARIAPPVASEKPNVLASVVASEAAASADTISQFESSESVTISMQVSVQQTTRLASGMDQAVRPTTLTRAAANQPAPVSDMQTQLAFSQSMHSRFVPSATGGTVVPPMPTVPNGAEQLAPALVVVPAPAITNEQVALYEQLTPMIQSLAIRELPKQVVGNERIVWFSPELPQSEKMLDEAPKSARKGRQKAWISAGMAASSFNPSVAMRPVSGLAYTNNAPTNALTSGAGPVPALALDSRAGRAIALQMSVGIPLSDHWTVESGVGLLNGQSVVQSPVRSSALSADKNSAAFANAPTLYTDLVGNSANQMVANSALDGNNGYTATAQRNAFVTSTSYDRAVVHGVSNTYQFVQVPVQLSYELRPRRKFGLAFLTGMVSNLFVRNTVADAITVKTQDGVYRPITVAGTAGMRLRFRPDKHWSASLAGTFQQSLHSITKPEVGVQALPQNMGVCFSVDRHF